MVRSPRQVVFLVEGAVLVAMAAVVALLVDVDLASGRFCLMVSTSVIGMLASFSPKCICTGTFGFSSANATIRPPLGDRRAEPEQPGRGEEGDGAAHGEADDGDPAGDLIS